MNVVLSKNAQKDYKHLPRTEQAKVKKKLASLEQNPYIGKKLTGELTGIRSLRAWPYRIFYEVSESKNRVEVHKIKHRQGAYKN